LPPEATWVIGPITSIQSICIIIEIVYYFVKFLFCSHFKAPLSCTLYIVIVIVSYSNRNRSSLSRILKTLSCPHCIACFSFAALRGPEMDFMYVLPIIGICYPSISLGIVGLSFVYLCIHMYGKWERKRHQIVITTAITITVPVKITIMLLVI